MPIPKVFRRFQPNIVSSRQVTEISNLVPGLNIQKSGRSSAAPLTPTRPIRKKVTSADRRAMLESFVNKYRAMNLGKFPSPTSAQKEVGGNYYLIRKMLQEMEYNFKKSSEEKGLVEENKKQTKSEDKIGRIIAIESSGSQEKLNTQITTDQRLCQEDRWIESVSNSDTKSGFKNSSEEKGLVEENKKQTKSEECNFKKSSQEKGFVEENKKQTKSEDKISRIIAIESSGSQEKLNTQVTIDQRLCQEDPWIESVSNGGTKSELKEVQPLTSSADTVNRNITRDDTQNIVTESHDRPFHEKLEHNANEEYPLQDNLGFENLESKVEQRDDGIRNISRDMHDEQKEELTEKQSIWGNLKSIATAFINIWKK